MFMFRSRRTALARRVWKARVGGHEGAAAEVRALLKRLKEGELEALVAAVESRGADLSGCVVLPRDPPLDPLLLCCQAWRWPDLKLPCELKRLPACRSTKDPLYVCCNPYHWSRLCKPGKTSLVKCQCACQLACATRAVKAVLQLLCTCFITRDM
ncbi:hypothetical protein PR048_010806 [Dryococelus australis]|uniref:MH1 domain-containing protein n=1 Tax=Dryococelus australis TaxID=614101 RepID=A0ABQ9I3S0_9NEOP|nr:hypothetical protein PR048_010806 [Dryococelus australis]